jgi:RNA polymerase sigma-70 factor (ECF subfamily)
LSADFYLTEAELNLAIQRSITKLPPRCRQIFQMSRMDNYSNAEIAEKLGISKRTVEIQISNALKILRQELSEFLPLWLLLML